MWIYYVRLIVDENVFCISYKEIIKIFLYCLNCILWINMLIGFSFGYKLFFYLYGIGIYFWLSVIELDLGIWWSVVVLDCLVFGDW